MQAQGKNAIEVVIYSNGLSIVFVPIFADYVQKVWLLGRPRKKWRAKVENDLNLTRKNKRSNVPTMSRVHVTTVAVEKQ
jgi:hypothetical protein